MSSIPLTYRDLVSSFASLQRTITNSAHRWRRDVRRVSDTILCIVYYLQSFHFIQYNYLHLKVSLVDVPPVPVTLTS
ncbi:hypothetical protein LZ554_005950 [Drepanopeziza brunnea f. sp. 'monogermtubi']|nr:hypothetical protein LZ554_005950 [Drepanopeziza brunnea f. sp. 'monogermtubi']